jgi:hypothetical protein
MNALGINGSLILATATDQPINAIDRKAEKQDEPNDSHDTLLCDAGL